MYQTQYEGRKIFHWFNEQELSVEIKAAIKPLCQSAYVDEHLAVFPNLKTTESGIPSGYAYSSARHLMPQLLTDMIGMGSAGLKLSLLRSDYELMQADVKAALLKITAPEARDNKAYKAMKLSNWRNSYSYSMRSQAAPIAEGVSFIDELGLSDSATDIIQIAYDYNDNIWLLVRSGAGEFAKAYKRRYANSPALRLDTIECEEFKAASNWVQYYGTQSRTSLMSLLLLELANIYASMPGAASRPVDSPATSISREQVNGRQAFRVRVGSTKADSDSFFIAMTENHGTSYTGRGASSDYSYNSCAADLSDQGARFIQLQNGIVTQCKKLTPLLTLEKGIIHEN